MLGYIGHTVGRYSSSVDNGMNCHGLNIYTHIYMLHRNMCVFVCVCVWGKFQNPVPLLTHTGFKMCLSWFYWFFIQRKPGPLKYSSTCYENYSVEGKEIAVLKYEKNIVSISCAISYALSSSNLYFLCTCIRTYNFHHPTLSGFQLTYCGGKMMKKKKNGSCPDVTFLSTSLPFSQFAVVLE